MDDELAQVITISASRRQFLEAVRVDPCLVNDLMAMRRGEALEIEGVGQSAARVRSIKTAVNRAAHLAGRELEWARQPTADGHLLFQVSA